MEEQPEEWVNPRRSEPGDDDDKVDDHKDNRNTREGNPDGPLDDGDDSDEEPEKPPHRDPFMPRMGSREVSTTPSPSIEAKARYAEQKCQQIVEFVCRNLGTKMMIPNRLKGARLDVKSMKKYDGTPSRETYWEWLQSMIFTYRASQMGGADRDKERVLILDSLLEGKAKAWFQHRLEWSDMPYPTFIETLIEMYHRFIHESVLQDARKAFRHAQWEDADEMVQGWHDMLQQLVDEMDIVPDEYSVWDKFLGGLLEVIRM